VRAAILALLKEGPRNGYQIMSEIAERSGGAWRPSPGAVYPALSQLADEGLIAGEEEDGRRTFSLTDAGRRYVAEHPERARGAWESAAQQEAWEVPGLFAEAARLGGGIVQIAHAGTREQVVAAERLLASTRRELYRILADDDSDPADSDPADSDPADSDPAGSAPAGSAPAGSAPAGSAPAGSAPAGAGPAANEPADSDSAAADSAGSGPAAAGPAANEPGNDEPASNEPEN
jgi:DNA-binding PadR family transcriptional regulator